MNFDHYLFRCSSLWHLMSEPVGKSPYQQWVDAKANFEKQTQDLEAMKKFDAKGNIMKSWEKKSIAVEGAKKIMDLRFEAKDEIQLSEGAKTHLMDIYISEKYGRNTEIENKYIKKGLAVEEDGITLYSRLKKVFFKKNEQQMKNLFIRGTPDMFVGKAIHEADRIPDIKCSWNVYTFYRTFIKDVNSLYYWQGMGYMWLTGAKYFDLAYCLVNTPESLIESEFKSIWYKLGCPDEDDGNFQDACKEIRKSLTYDDIPLNEKLLEYTIERNDDDIELIKKKVTAARKFLNELHDQLTLKFAA